MLKNNFEVEILVNGKPVKEYHKDGKVFIEGKKISKYSIRIRNNSSRRILAVPTVDGLSVLNGKTASYDSTGYIIDKYNSITIDGWRRSDKEVNEFYFSFTEDSYAEMKGEGRNQGVIGVAIFYEKENEHLETKYKYTFDRFDREGTPYYPPTTPLPHIPPYIYNEKILCVADCNETLFTYTTDNVSNCSCEVSNKDIKQDVGTGWGDSKRSEVTQVSFKREPGTVAVFEIFYNTREELDKIGIDFNKRPTYVNEPKSFPNEYCEPPRK